MPLHHFLPATYLAGFSDDPNPIRRQRRIWVGDKRTGNVFEAPVSRVCAINDFYTLREPGAWSPQIVDESWSFYERSLAPAIQQIILGTINAKTWLTVLVRFVAGLLVRGPDFNSRFLRRFHSAWPDLQQYGALHQSLLRPDNTNMARLMEVQRLLGPLCGARWCVRSTSGNIAQIVSDLGFVGFGNPETGATGLALPLDPYRVLTLTPRMEAFLAVARNGTWVPEIHWEQVTDADHMTFNATVAATAQRFIFGATEGAVRSHLRTQDLPPLVPEAADLGFIAGRRASVHEMLFFDLLGIIAKPPHHPEAKIYIDFSKKIERAEALGRWVDI